MSPHRYFTRGHRPPALIFHARSPFVQHTLVALVQDRPGVLNRAVSVFRRRSINIESLTVERTEQSGISRMTWVVSTDDLPSIVAQLEKLIDVLEVYEVRAAEFPGASPSRAVAMAEAMGAGAPSSSLAAAQADGAA